jgi:hypothetical protein
MDSNLPPTETGGDRGEKQAAPANGSSTRRIYRAQIEISAKDYSAVLPEVAIALCVQRGLYLRISMTLSKPGALRCADEASINLRPLSGVLLRRFVSCDLTSMA